MSSVVHKCGADAKRKAILIHVSLNSWTSPENWYYTWLLCKRLGCLALAASSHHPKLCLSQLVENTCFRQIAVLHCNNDYPFYIKRWGAMPNRLVPDLTPLLWKTMKEHVTLSASYYQRVSVIAGLVPALIEHAVHVLRTVLLPSYLLEMPQASDRFHSQLCI